MGRRFFQTFLDVFVPVFLAGLVLLVSGCDSSGERGAKPLSSWNIATIQTDDPGRAVRDGVWHPADLNSLFRTPPPHGKSLSYVWLKTRIDLADPAGFYGISLGRVYIADRLYVNGTLCGEFNTETIKEIHRPRFYTIPEGLLKEGPNEVLVHLGIYGREYGGLRGTPALLSKKVFNRMSVRQGLIYQDVPLSIMVVFLVMLITVALNYDSGDRKYPVMILAGILCVWLFHLFMIFSPYQPFSLEFRINTLWLCSFANSAFFMLFIQFNYKVYFKSLNRYFLSLILMSSVLTLIFHDTTAPFYPGRILGSLMLFLTLGVMVYLLVYIQRVKKYGSIRLFWLFGFIPGLGIGLDILNYLFGSRVPVFAHVYTIPVMNFLVILLQRRSLDHYRNKLETISLKLRRSRENEGHGASPITQKMDTLKAYIDQHYTSALSREALAEYMELSPDYMGRMFKARVGVTINQYINELRIQEACHMLRETDEKIVDIAFAVGFESLPTFNRAFIKKVRVSPSEYRLRELESHQLKPQT